MPINNPYGGYLDDPSSGVSGAGTNPYAGFISALQKKREQPNIQDQLKTLRDLVMSMPSAPQMPVPQPGPMTPPSTTYSTSLDPSGVYSPDDYEKGVSTGESGGDWTIVNKGPSQAGGRYQFIPQTWEALTKQGLPLTPEGRTSDTPEGRYQQRLAFKTSTDQNAQVLKQALGRMPTHAELYTAHFFGPGYATSVLQNRETPLKALLPKSFIEQNPWIAAMTGDDLVAVLGKRFNK